MSRRNRRTQPEERRPCPTAAVLCIALSPVVAAITQLAADLIRLLH